MPRGVSLQERFWSKVDKSGGPDACWLFTGYRDPDGYGRFGLVDGKTRGAHCVALEFHLGRKLVPGEQGLHDCDNPPCVRVGPGHVKLGDVATNHRDKVARGRQSHVAPYNHSHAGPTNPARGERHPKAKLASNAVLAIRDSPEPLRILAALFGISLNQVSLIKRRKAWRHLPEAAA